MKSKLRLSLIQTSLFWESPEKNRNHIQQQLENLSGKTDLILLPEMFTSGFTMQPQKVAETLEGETVQWMKQWAQKTNSAIGGSVVIQEKEAFYNRFLFISPQGNLQTYNKKHTFTLAGEHKAYQSGTEDGIIEYREWKICLRICYDLRFPVWNRNTQDYDLLIFVANWPKTRILAWDTLLQARAIENMAYVAGVNIVGSDPNGFEYPGHTAAFDVLGQKLVDCGDQQQTATVILDPEELRLRRRQLRFLADRDNFDWC